MYHRRYLLFLQLLTSHLYIYEGLGCTNSSFQLFPLSLVVFFFHFMSINWNVVVEVVDTVGHLDGSFAMRSRPEIPQSCRYLAAGVFVLSLHTVVRERVSLNMQPGI